MKKQTIKDIDVKGKRVLVRVDYNVPLDPQSGAITDDTRIRATLPTLRYLLDQRARIILCSHLGRPDGKIVEKLRLAPVARCLSQLLGQPVKTVNDCIGPEAERAAAELKEGEILLLENLRFHPEEEKNDPAFAEALSRLGEIFVNDAFGTMHRAHASTVGVTRYLPAVAGFLVEKELDIMGKTLTEPARPFATVLGGAKVSDKIRVLENILGKVDSLLLGGGMACTFLRAKNYAVGRSPVEEDKLDFARKMMDEAEKRGVKVLLPSDVVVAEKPDSPQGARQVPVAEIPSDWYIVDIGSQTVENFSQELKRCHTVLWNGPVGINEIPQFARGTRAIVQLLSELQATTVIGGGSTAEVVEELGLVDKMTHVSTGGGASLMFLEGRVLPGVAALRDKEEKKE